MTFLVLNSQVLGKGIRRWIMFFVLRGLIDVYLQRGFLLLLLFLFLFFVVVVVVVVVAFIDYIKAFDNVQRGKMWGKLLSSGVNGKVLCVIRDMYPKAKSCMKTRHGLSQCFVSNVG